jgi:hypothetical protein
MEDITLSSLLDVIGELISNEISIAVSNTKSVDSSVLTAVSKYVRKTSVISCYFY